MSHIPAERNTESSSSNVDSHVVYVEITSDSPTLAMQTRSQTFPSEHVTRTSHVRKEAISNSDAPPRSTEETASNQSSRHSKHSRERPATPAKPPGIAKQVFQKFGDLISPSPTPERFNSEFDKIISGKNDEIRRLKNTLCEKNKAIQRLTSPRPEDAQRTNESITSSQEVHTWHQEQHYPQFQNHYLQLEHHNAQLEAHVRNLEGEIGDKDQKINLLKNKLDESATLIRQQQEKAFKHMEAGGWLPSEETRVVNDLSRIRRDMRAWAKGFAMKDILRIETLEAPDYQALMADLGCVVALENGRLPQVLSIPKSPMILLNAILAYDVYRTIFENPFFFLKYGLDEDLPGTEAAATLNNVHRLLQDSNQADAHSWRSQTLRNFLPPPRPGEHDGERKLRGWTEGMIRQASLRQAHAFAAGPARHLINFDTETDHTKKLNLIYQEAGMMAYLLWTRKTTMRCTTLKDMGDPAFDIDNPEITPHSLVHYEEHDDKLKGRPISVVVNPLLQVYGTDEAKDYDKGRVWAAAEVWLDSKDK